MGIAYAVKLSNGCDTLKAWRSSQNTIPIHFTPSKATSVTRSVRPASSGDRRLHRRQRALVSIFPLMSPNRILSPPPPQLLISALGVKKESNHVDRHTSQSHQTDPVKFVSEKLARWRDDCEQTPTRETSYEIKKSWTRC
mgnify:CR=1 FL=1